MATYAIGDVQGCFDELQALLAKAGFDPARDTLWFVGDLVNRGPKSLEVLRFVRGLGGRARTVLGNHDLHLLAVARGHARTRDDDTLGAVLAAPDRDALLDWLRSQPLMHAEGGWAMVHAGVLPGWSVARALALASEVHAELGGADPDHFLARMYGAKPVAWDDALAGADRLRVIVNAMTRMRFCSPGGEMELKTKGESANAPPGYLPWFEARKPGAGEPALLFGHWSVLGLHVGERVVGLDSGCVWGGALSAIRLEDRRLLQVDCPGYSAIR